MTDESIADDSSVKAEPENGLNAVCGINGRPGQRHFGWQQPTRTSTFRNHLNMIMVQHQIGAAQSGVSCDASCRPQPWGYAHASSAWANIPFSVRCHANTNHGASGRSMRHVAYTGCSHRAVLGASLNITKGGVGLGATLNINSVGSVQLNGGALTASCAYY